MGRPGVLSKTRRHKFRPGHRTPGRRATGVLTHHNLLHRPAPIQCRPAVGHGIRIRAPGGRLRPTRDLRGDETRASKTPGIPAALSYSSS